LEQVLEGFDFEKNQVIDGRIKANFVIEGDKVVELRSKGLAYFARKENAGD